MPVTAFLGGATMIARAKSSAPITVLWMPDAWRTVYACPQACVTATMNGRAKIVHSWLVLITVTIMVYVLTGSACVCLDSMAMRAINLV